jgi:hypothetical protein
MQWRKASRWYGAQRGARVARALKAGQGSGSQPRKGGLPACAALHVLWASGVGL